MLFDQTAEAALLGAAMLHPDAAEAVATIDPRAFAGEDHRTVAERITYLIRQGRPVDLATVTHRTSLTTFPRMLCQELAEGCPFPSHWPDYARSVREAAGERAYAERLSQVTSDLADGTITRKEAQAAMEALLDAKMPDDATAESLAPALSDGLNALEAAWRGDLSVRGVPTGYKDLDDIIGGLAGGSFYAIGARTGHGKTMFGLNLSLLAAEAGHKVLFISIEQSRREVVQRLLSMRSKVPFAEMRRGMRGSDADWERIMEAADHLATLPWQGAYQNVTTADVRRLIREHLPSVVFIDYLQLMDVGSYRDSRWGALEATARNLRHVAQTLDCAMVVMAQLNREGVGDNPGLHNFREASIEQDCDVAMLLVPGKDGRLEVRVEKNRHGPTGVASLKWWMSTGRMEDAPVVQRAQVVPMEPYRADIHG